MPRANLRVVPPAPKPEIGPKEILAQVVPELIEAEQVVIRLRQIMAEQGRLLAKERGVAFVRPESLRAEFRG